MSVMAQLRTETERAIAESTVPVDANKIISLEAGGYVPGTGDRFILANNGTLAEQLAAARIRARVLGFSDARFAYINRFGDTVWTFIR